MVGPSFGLLSAMIVVVAEMTSGLAALPPGERDLAYQNTAPADTLIYTEWATRGSGEEGGKGIDGLLADPEMKTFFSDVKTATLKFLEENQENAPPALYEHVPPLVLDLVHRSGCLYISYTAPDNVEERLQNETWLDLAGGARLTLIINGGEGADEIEKHLLGLLPLMMPGADPPQDLNEFPIPNPFGIQATFDRENDYFIVAIGKGTLERAHGGLKGEVKGLADVEEFQKSFQSVDMERLGTLGWVNIAAIRDQGLSLAGPFGNIARVMIDQLGLGNLNNVVSATGLIEGQIATRTFVETGPELQGVLSLAAGRGLTAKDFEQVPGDCDFVTSWTLDLPLVRGTVLSLIEQVQPGLIENYNALESQVESELGFSVEEDFLQAFGQQMTVFDSPSAGGFFVTSLTLALEVKDPAKAEKIFEKLMGLLEATLPGDRSNEYSRRGVFLEKKTFMDQTVYFVNTIGDDIPFAPAFCLTDKQLLIAPHPQALKAQLRFVKEGSPNYSERFSKTAPKGKVISFGTLSADKLIELMYAAAPFAAQVGLSEAQKMGIELDVFSIPSAKSIMPYMEESRGWVVRTETGLLFESRTSLPLAFGSLPTNFLFFMSKPVPARFEAVEEQIIE